MASNNVDALAALSNMTVESHSDFLREVLLRAVTQVMDAEVATACNAEYGERSDSRENARNGYRPRALETRMGTLELAIPKLRQGSYLPSFLAPRRRWEQAFVNVVCEAYVLGVSTRKVEDLVEAMGARGMSRSEVSRMAATLDTQVTQFRQRALEGRYPYVWLDAVYVKVREGVRVVSKAVLIAHAVSADGFREVLGVDVAAGEMEDAWRQFLAGLVERGLKGVRLVISDAHAGLKAARRGVFNSVPWQRCRVHFMRNVLCRVRKPAQGFVSATLRHVFDQPDIGTAREAMREAVKLLEEKYPAASTVVSDASEDVLAFKSFPEKHWRQIHSTNPLERLNKEVRRRTDVVGIFPNDASALRLITMLLVEQNDEWAVGRRYFSLESLVELEASPSPPPQLEHGSAMPGAEAA